MSDAPVTLRPITPDDLPFLLRVYARTREEELERTGWGDAEKAAFVTMQFDLQHRYYQEHFPDARFDVISEGERPLGRLYVDRPDDCIHIIDIALLPEARGRGIGGALLREILDEGLETARPVRIHVEKFNRALRLYQRLGFTKHGDTGVYDLMEWSPAPPSPTAGAG